MKKFFLLTLGLMLLLLASLALADGIPLDPEYYKVPDLTEETQIALIDFDGQAYTTNLFVSIDFTGYKSNQLLWIVPFEEVPENVNLEAKTFEQFKEDFSAFDDEMNQAIELNEKYFKGGYVNELLIIDALVFVPGILWAPLLVFSLVGGIGAPGAGGRMDLTGAPGELSVYGPGLEIVGFEDFGELGTAITYNVKDTASLANFFQVNNTEIPENLSEFQDKIIVVFRLNKTQNVLNVLASFEFKNNEKIFYPSSTTKTWKGQPSNYDVRVKAPKDFKLTPNFNPNIEVVSPTSQYLVFTAECDPNEEYEVIGNYKNNCLRKRYYSYGEPHDQNAFLPLVNQQLVNENLEIEVKAEHKALPVGFLAAACINASVLALIIILVCWLAAWFYYCRINKLKMPLPKKILNGLALPVIWFFINVAGVTLFYVVMMASVIFFFTISFALNAVSIPAFEILGLLMILFLFLVPYAAIAGLLYLAFKKTKGFRSVKIPVSGLNLRKLILIYVFALAVNIVLLVLMLTGFTILI